MSDAKGVRFTMKAVINKEKSRVLFAEVDYNFANVLLCFCTLPLGLIMQALVKHYGDKAPLIGSLNNLYNSLKSLCYLGDTFQLQGRLLKPETGYAFPSLPYHSASDRTYFIVLVIFYQNTSFIIRDDLWMVSNGKESIIETFNNVGVDIVDMDGVQIRNVTLGVNEVMNFLVRLLISGYPLSDIVLGTAVKSGQESSMAQKKFPKVESEAGIPLQQSEEEATSNQNMNLKLILQKSTNKLLFAQADKQFVNYLFSILRIPLRRVDCHLGSNTCLKNIDTLHRSLTALARKYLDDKYTKDEPSFPFEEFVRDESRMYMVTDDLTVTPLCLISSISLLAELKISLSDVQELELQIGLEEVLGILKASLTSTHALTDGLISHILEKQPKPKYEN